MSLLLMGAGVPGLFSPVSISGLQLWLKADSLALNDGDLVTTWADSSGNGKDATGAGAVRPTYKANILNGLPVVRFGGSHFLDQASFSQSQPATIFAVSKLTLAGASNRMIFSKNGGAGEHTLYYGSQLLSMYAGSIVTGGSSLLNAWDVLTATWNGGSSSGWVNGGTAAITGNVGSQATTTYRIGSNTSSAFLTGDIAEIIYYSGALSLANRQAVQAYLGAKYGISVT